jgi:hypothetical protein
VGSNPTPRAYHGYSSNKLIAIYAAFYFKMTLGASNVSQTVSSLTQNETAEDLDERIDALTQFGSKPFYNKILKTLTRENPLNATIICDYIDAERTEINIKQSTMEGKIKILVWLSTFHSIKQLDQEIGDKVYGDTPPVDMLLHNGR